MVIALLEDHTVKMSVLRTRKEKKGDAFRRQFNKKLSIKPSCPGVLAIAVEHAPGCRLERLPL